MASSLVIQFLLFYLDLPVSSTNISDYGNHCQLMVPTRRIELGNLGTVTLLPRRSSFIITRYSSIPDV